MNFELGKSYIVNVTEKGIIPSMEFDRSKWFNKDYDDLEVLTDEEKRIIRNDLLDQAKAEIEQIPTNYVEIQRVHSTVERYVVEVDAVLRVLDKYKEGRTKQDTVM